MMTLIITTVGLAGLFGFCLAAHVFLHRLNIAKPLKWVGTVVGGTVLGAFMAVITLMVIWPPVNGIMVIGGIALLVAVAALVALPGSQRVAADQVCFLVNKNLGVEGDLHESKEIRNLDLNPSAGPARQ